MCKQACSLEATVIGTSLRPSFWHARDVDKPNSGIYANRLGWAPRCAWACVGCPVRSLDCAAKHKLLGPAPAGLVYMAVF